MAFSDPRYLFVLAFVAVITAKLPAGTARLMFVLVVSILFAAGLGFTVLVLLGIAIVSYFGGIAIDQLPEGRQRSSAFAVSLTITILPLLFYKYWNPLASATVPSLQLDSSLMILPVGISFYTFLAAGYLIDVFVGNVGAERSPLRYGALVSFFPQMSAGPIGRAPQLLPQIANLGQFDGARVVSGLQSILIGLFLKVVIADAIAPFVSRVYSNVQSFGGLDSAIATIYFSFQVYADFAGYSLIAIGSARILGIELMQNFKQPYLSESLPDYWRRWHISLSSWFRDYVFVPLQFRFRRSRSVGLVGALIFTFTLVGIWHGAGPQYAIFGMIHGLLVAFSTLTFAGRSRFWRGIGFPAPLLSVIRVALTFLTVTATFVIFRAETLGDAMAVYSAIAMLHLGKLTLPLWPLLAGGLLLAGDIAVARGFRLSTLPTVLRWVVYYLTTTVVVIFMIIHATQDSSASQQFIYFKF